MPRTRQLGRAAPHARMWLSHAPERAAPALASSLQLCNQLAPLASHEDGVGDVAQTEVCAELERLGHV